MSEMSRYGALIKIADIHYQATSRRHRSECAVCTKLDDGEVVGVKFPCPTRVLVDEALGLVANDGE